MLEKQGHGLDTYIVYLPVSVLKHGHLLGQ